MSIAYQWECCVNTISEQFLSGPQIWLDRLRIANLYRIHRILHFILNACKPYNFWLEDWAVISSQLQIASLSKMLIMWFCSNHSLVGFEPKVPFPGIYCTTNLTIQPNMQQIAHAILFFVSFNRQILWSKPLIWILFFSESEIYKWCIYCYTIFQLAEKSRK